MDRAPTDRGVPLERGAAPPHPRPGSDLRHHRHTPIARHGHPGQADCAGFTLAEWLCRTADRINPARMCGSFYRLGRGSSALHPANLRSLLQSHQNAPVTGQRRAGLSPRSANWNHQFMPDPWRTSSPLRTDLGFRYTQDNPAALAFVGYWTVVSTGRGNTLS